MRLAASIAILLAWQGAWAQAPTARERYQKGMALYTLNDFDGALREFEEGFKLEPRAEFLYNIAQSHRKLGRREKAAEFYRKYLEFKPDASDRAEVEGFIHELDRPVEKPPAPVEKPPEKPIVLAAPDVRPAPSPPESAPVWKRWWLWTIVGGVVALGAVTGLGVALTTPRDAQVPPGAAGEITLTFK
jgi:tetratricopeptide (TPR) repeat protein